MLPNNFSAVQPGFTACRSPSVVCPHIHQTGSEGRTGAGEGRGLRQPGGGVVVAEEGGIWRYSRPQHFPS